MSTRTTNRGGEKLQSSKADRSGIESVTNVVESKLLPLYSVMDEDYQVDEKYLNPDGTVNEKDLPELSVFPSSDPDKKYDNGKAMMFFRIGKLGGAINEKLADKFYACQEAALKNEPFEFPKNFKYGLFRFNDMKPEDEPVPMIYDDGAMFTFKLNG